METTFSLSPVEEYLQQSEVGQQDSVPEQTAMATAIPSIKVEEHVAPSTITPDLLSLASPESTTSFSPSKQTKKRKSWGQVLPEPKTTLPPRKRAKTADEKEQRRIERVKRNRLAAHNSRERKREEMEKLQIVNDGLVAQMDAMREQMKAMAAEISALRGGSSSDSVPSSVTAFDFALKQTSHPTQAPSSIVSPPMTATTSVLETPELGNLDSPDMETLDDFPTTPMEDAFGGENPSELTQQSAALLCDLQCRSQRSLSCLSSSSQPTPSPSLNNSSNSSSHQTQQQLQQLALTALLTASLNLQLFLSNVSTLSSTSTVRTQLQRLSSLRPSHLPTLSTSPTPSPPQHQLQLLSMIYWTTALARQATSSTSSQPTKAHLQKVATGLAAQLRTELTLSSSPRQSSCEREAGTVVGGGSAGAGRRARRSSGGDEVTQRRRPSRRSRARRRIVTTWQVKTAVTGVNRGFGNNGQDQSSRLGMALQKLRERSMWR